MTVQGTAGDNDDSDAIIDVSVTPAPVVQEETKSCKPCAPTGMYREYVVILSNHRRGVLLRVQYRFSELHKRFHGLWPPLAFPSRGWFWDDYTINETNVQKRANQMQEYFEKLVNAKPELLRLGHFYDAFGVQSADCQVLQDLGRHLCAQKRSSISQVRDEQVSQQQKAQRREKKAWEQAQTINMSDPTARSSLRFHSSRTFELSSRMFTFAATEIRSGPNKRTWFSLKRANVAMDAYTNLTYGLFTQRGERLLKFVEDFRTFDYMCDLYYVTSSGDSIWAGRVHRKVGGSDLEELYTLTLAADGWVTCSGRWDNCLIKVNNETAVQVEESKVSFMESYSITISPDQDCLMLLGFCCAIGRIHAAFEHNRGTIGTATGLYYGFKTTTVLYVF